jgi:ATP-binding cassette subfamily C protein
MNSSARNFFAQLARTTLWRLVGAVALMVAFSLTEGFGIVLLLPMLQAAGIDLVGQGQAQRYAQIISRAFRTFGTQPSLAALLIVFVALVAARAALGRLQSVAIYAVAEEFELDLRTRLYRAIANASWLHVCRSRWSDFAHTLTDEAGRSGFAASQSMMLVGDAILASLYVAIALTLSAAMTVVVLLSAGLLAAMMRGPTRSIEESGHEVSRTAASFYAATLEHLQNLKTARAYGAEKQNCALFECTSHQATAANVAAQKLEALATARFELGAAVILGAALYASIRWLAVPPAEILILLALFLRVMPRFMSMHQRWRTLAGLMPSFENLVRVEAGCVEAAEPHLPAVSKLECNREIRLDDVTFSYGRSGACALHSVSLVIPAGAVVALVGPSGAGKSTIADLVMGLIEPDAGLVTIDGVPLTPERARQWRARVGYVAPDVFLFHDSIRANLKWANPNAGEAQIGNALRMADADEFVTALPTGLDTLVGDRGVALSQGERQRLALARALVRDPQLLVLDEATNNLDSASESRVLDALDRLPEKTSTILIAHRIATVKWADLIYVIENGTVVESGDWNALSARPNGRFYAMREEQELGAQPQGG